MTKMTTLGEICAAEGGLIQTGPFGSQLKQSEYTEEGTPVIMPKDISDGQVDTSTIARVPPRKAHKLARHTVYRGTIVMPRRGAINKRALISEEQEGFLCGTGCIKIELADKSLSPQFLFYYLDQPHVIEWIERRAIGSTMLNLNTSIIEQIEVPLVPREKQDRITSILSAYDDLIANNRRRIALLEESARLLFEEWFVHLRFPGHEHVRIEDGVPEGWERVSAADIIHVKPRTTAEKGKEILYIPMASLSETGMTMDPAKFERRTKHTSVRFRNGDVLFARITPCLENGKTGFVQCLAENEVACGSTEFIVLRGNRVSPYFTYCLARTGTFRQHAIKSMIGSSGRQRVQDSCFDKYRLGLPPKPLLDEFDSMASSCFNQVHTLDNQNARLQEARDLLLPRLMRGDLTA